jgi:4-cresol dehydrogenase (hydroxylating)
MTLAAAVPIAEALEAWSRALGPEHVLTDRPTRSAVETATFLTTQRVAGVLRPADREQVQECLRIANRYRTPLYPVSGGKNWGYGSRVPVADGSVLLDLGRMNRIVEINEELAYATVEPGVTFRQLAEALAARRSKLILSVTGSSPDASLIGNALERGIGKGPYGDRSAHACALEVVLPNGQCLHTGFDRFPGAKAGNVSRGGVGPALDGLFFQSNLGIVTRMTIWLVPRPRSFQTFYYYLRDEDRLEGLVDELRRLRLEGVIRTTFVLANAARLLSTRPDLARPPGRGAWFGEGALFAAGRAQACAERTIIQEALRGKVDRLFFLDESRVRWARRFGPLARWMTGHDLSDSLDSLYGESPFLGRPTSASMRMAYWKRPGPRPADPDPDRDGCGLLWCSPAVPFDGRQVRAVVRIIEETLRSHRFEPNLGLNCVTERCIDVTAAILFDRGSPGQDGRALDCHGDLSRRLAAEGYLPYRLGVSSMDSLPPSDEAYGSLLRALKDALDPQGILAPGRYES